MAKSCWGLCVGVVAVVHSTVNVAAPELVCSPCCLGEPGLAAFSFCMVDDGNARDVYSRMLTSGFVWAWVADVWVYVSLGCWRLGLCEPGLLTSGFVWAWVADVWVCVSLGCWRLGLCEPGLLMSGFVWAWVTQCTVWNENFVLRGMVWNEQKGLASGSTEEVKWARDECFWVFCCCFVVVVVLIKWDRPDITTLVDWV